MSASSINLDDVHNITREISWIVRSGLPLEHHLADIGRGHGQRLERLTGRISDGLKRGESLESLIRDESRDASRMLAGAVAAGIQSGDLASSVEMMGDLATDLVDLRRQIFSAMSYPLVVVACAWLLFVLLTQHFLQQIWTAIQGLELDIHPVLRTLLHWNDIWWWWPWLVPAAGFLLLLGWVWSGRATAMAFRGPERLLTLLPGVGGLLRDLRFCTLSRMLAFLTERGVPLTDTLRSAGACCGSAPLDDACQRTAGLMESGAGVPEVARHRWLPGQLPPMLQTCLRQSDGNGERFAMRLRAVSEHYRARIELNGLWLKMLMPVALFLVIAGGTVVAYAASVFWPMTEIYRHLG